MFQWQQQHKNMQICHSTPLSEKQFQDNGSHLSSNLQTTDDNPLEVWKQLIQLRVNQQGTKPYPLIVVCFGVDNHQHTSQL